MKIISPSTFLALITKSKKETTRVEDVVRKIISTTQKNGDKALISYSNQFDKTNFKTAQDFVVTAQEFLAAEKTLTKDVKSALKLAAARIKRYHQKQMPKDFSFKDELGVMLGNRWQAIESVGVYVPGGTASYPSSVLMSVVPALVAGVKEIVICAPSSQGQLNPAVLFAAKICDVKKIYKIGGAQAVSAMTYGTKTISPVNKIVGPGNAFVASAKKILFGEVGIDMIAGPTDVTIIADKNANPNWIAADVLSQLEHGVDSRAFVLTDDQNLAKKISAAVLLQSKKLPRKEIIDQSLKNSAILVVEKLDEATEIINQIAPEHLEIVTKNPQKILPKIKNAGAIFLGNYTPEAIGDYIAGPSHTLPTEGTAKFTSGLSVFDFLKRISLISCNKNSFTKLAQATSILASCEGLEAHNRSIKIRTCFE